jgi:hypothetical protein
MSTALGTQTVFGVGVESSYGTAATITEWHEILSEALERRPNYRESNTLRRGTGFYRRGARQVETHRDAGGIVTLEVARAGFSTWFEQMLGSQPTPGVFVPGALTGKSLTIQKGLADESGTVIGAFTYLGCKIPVWELSVAADGVLQAALTVDARDEVTNIAEATASYVDRLPFAFEHGALSIGGSAVARVFGLSVSNDNTLRTDRRYLGHDGLKAEQPRDGFAALTGTLDTEFYDLATFYNRFRDNAPVSLAATFTAGGDILEITIPEIRLRGETPKVDGPELIDLTVPFIGLSNGTDPVITIAATEDEGEGE